MFVLLQRYTFWSNSQQDLVTNIRLDGCLYYCKDTLFEAIHNRWGWVYLSRNVVCITAKIHFLKQFTTIKVHSNLSEELFVLLQRYTFWSNSQPLSTLWIITKCCLYYCKDTLFEAIHNYFLRIPWISGVVCITAKIHFLKQFTTAWKQLLRYPQLFVLLQRYTFWSNSQLLLRIMRIILVVCITAKIHFLKQFTTR